MDRPCFEGMEPRLLLDVSAIEYGLLRAMYPDLKLSASMATYNIIEIQASELTSPSALVNAIAKAGTTPQSDLIVVRTGAAAAQNTVTMGGTELVINIDARKYGSVIIVSLGDAPLTLNGGSLARVFSVGSGDTNNGTVVGLGGLTIRNGGTSVTAMGGGIYNHNATVTVTHCTLTGNRANYGAGIYNSIGSSLTVTQSTLTSNTAANHGGGIYNSSAATLSVTSSFIQNNSANGTNGGGIYNAGTTRVTNSLLTGNGTGIYHCGSATLLVTNCTIAGNSNGIYTIGPVRLTNSIVVSNSRDIYCGFTTVYGYNNLSSFIEWTNGFSGRNYISNGAGVFAPGSYALAENSPAINRGVNSYATDAGLNVNSRDLAGNKRFVGGAVDIGAYEHQGTAATPSDPVPAVVLVSNSGWRSVTLSWSKVAQASGGYIVEWSLKGKSALVGSQTVSSSTLSLEIGDLQPGTAYTFRVYTVLGTKKSNAYASASETTKTVPGPQSVKAKADGIGAIGLTWLSPKPADMPADLTLIGYNIYDARKGAPAAPIATVGPEALAYPVEGLTPNTSYSFRVVAVYTTVAEGGPVEIESTKPVTVKAKTVKFVAPKFVKAAAGDIGLTTITIRWQPHDNADDFRVECWLKKVLVPLDFDPDTGNASFFEIDDKIVGIKITGLLPSTKYSFVINGMNSELGAVSAALKKSIGTVKFPATKKPASVKSALRPSSAALTWKSLAMPKNVSGSATYELFYTDQKGLKPGADGWTLITDEPNEDGIWATLIPLVDVKGNVVLSATIEGLASGTVYYVYLRSLWDQDHSVLSNSAVLTIKTPLL